MSLLLLMGAGLLVRTLVNLQAQSFGFDRRNLVLFRLDPVQAGYHTDQLPTLYQELQRRLGGLPGVRSVSVSENTLINGGAWIDAILIQGYTPKPGDSSDGQVNVWLNPVGPGFFRTMGIPVLLGRPIDARDTPSAPKVAVINQTLARHCFPGSIPVGHRLGGFGGSKSSDFQIVGVVGDTKYGQLRDKAPPTVYIAYAQHPDPGPTSVEVRTAGDPKQWMSAVRGAVQSLDRNLPLFDFETQTEQIEQATFQERLFARFFSFFGLLALTLACVGLYGMMSYAVARRTSEIGIRMALGAERASISRMVLWESMTLAGLGTVIGVAAALAASRLIATLLYGLKPTDPLTIASATAVLTAVALLAGYLPAHRASRVDPMVALRYE
jgi:predicted permease